jgi:hypothetical protein
VQIVENWTDIDGKIISCTESQDISGYLVVEIAVKSARDVSGFANLLDHSVGETLAVLVPEDLVTPEVRLPETDVTCRVRRGAKNRTFVHPEKFTLKG